MRHSLAALIRRAAMTLIQRCGPKIIDQRTGRVLGRALFIPWKGRVLVIGLDAAARPVFLPQTRLTYWHQELGFASHPTPDFPSEFPRP